MAKSPDTNLRFAKNRPPTKGMLVANKKRTGKLDASLTVIPTTTRKDDGKSKYQVLLKQAAAGDPNKPLTEKQRAFVKHWARGESPYVAAHKAGFAGVASGYITMRMPAAIKLYEREKQLYEEAAQMTRKQVMDMLKESYEMAKLMAEPATMVGAAREIGKMCGYYAPEKKELVLTDETSQKRRMERMSDEELERLVGGNLPAGALESIKEAEHARSVTISYDGPTGAALADEFDVDEGDLE